jgi:hypothetical protein
MRSLRSIFHCLLLFSLMAASAALVFAQEAGPKDVHAQLSLAADKSIYRMGEPIRLVLSFTADAAGYQLNITTTKPASPIDDVLISPGAGAFRWLDECSGKNRYVPDYMTVSALSLTPVRVELPLNDWVRFDRAGRYTVRVKTNRVSHPSRPHDYGPALPLTSNEVSFEIVPMTESEEGREVMRLNALFDATKDWQEEAKISEELLYLSGDPSTREKVRRFLNPQNRSGNYFQNIQLGLFTARNRQLVLKLLEDALRDPQTGVTYQLLGTLTRLRLLMKERSAKTDAKQASSEDEQRASAQIQQAYVDELASSLAKRSGESRTTTAMTILMSLPKEQAQAANILSKVREILLEEFDNLHPFSQEYLLSAYWEQLRAPVLLTSLKRMLAQNAGPQGQLIRNTVLGRLIEMSPEEARPFIIAEIRDPASLASFDVMKRLPDATLPEVDAALLRQIRARAPLTERSDDLYLKNGLQLAARYASAAIYADLMQVYQSSGSKWQPELQASLLGYFARHNEKEAQPLIEQALEKLGAGQDLFFLGELTAANYTDGIDAILRKRLESDDPQTIGAAAYIMSERGPAAGQALIEARLARWVSAWGARAAELDSAGENETSAVVQKMVQVNLILALIQAKSWKLTDSQKKELEQGCLTQRCRQYFHLQ